MLSFTKKHVFQNLADVLQQNEQNSCVKGRVSWFLTEGHILKMNVGSPEASRCLGKEGKR